MAFRITALAVIFQMALAADAIGAGEGQRIEVGVGKGHEPEAVTKPRRAITIATIGAQPLVVTADTPPQAVVQRMIGHWRSRFAQVLPDRPDLIVVPEACDRPRGLPRQKLIEYYRVRKNQIRDFFAQVARKNRCYVVYSAKRELPDGTWRNSSMLLDRQGTIAGIYNKNHPTVGEMEAGILCGKDAPVFACDFGSVACAICFDLNFDALRLKYVERRPDLIVFSSMYHGGLMQAYWAYSCRCHFVGAIERRCPSEIRNPLGEVVASNSNYFDFAVARVNLDSALVHLDGNWGRLRDLKKKYGPQVTVADPGYLGAVLISSEHPTITVDDMIEEFKIERLDDYMKRSLEFRRGRTEGTDRL